VPAVVASWWGSRRWGWPGLVASAALATFAAIAVTLAMLPPPHPVGLASAPSKPGLPATADDPAQRASLLEPGSAVTTSTLAGGTPVAVVRDPRLDAYLAAHKQFAGSSALGVPSAFLRSATVDSKGP
jgi:sigma-E factor negative regulatory protein RseA